MKVKCYRNLNRKGIVWSVVDKQTGLVVDRTSNVYLTDCQLVVSQAGNKRVREQGRKNVHATVRGTRLKQAPVANWTRVSYNPYTMTSFTTADGSPIFEAKYIKLNKKGCWVTNE